jgi:hypothetical protein
MGLSLFVEKVWMVKFVVLLGSLGKNVRKQQ